MTEKGSLWLKTKHHPTDIRGSCRGNMDLEGNILSSDRRETRSPRTWLCALPSVCVHFKAELRLEPGPPHLLGVFVCRAAHSLDE